jgi:hypothetical protein
VWEPEGNRILLEYSEATEVFRAVAISADGKRVAAGGTGTVVKVWNLK